MIKLFAFEKEMGSWVTGIRKNVFKELYILVYLLKLELWD